MPQLEALARAGSEAIRLAFERYRGEFQRITRRARLRFERRDWLGGQKDATDRLDLYRRLVDEVVETLNEELGHSVADPVTWKRMKAVHTEDIANFPDEELAETFFNSVTRRIFDTVGVDPDIEFVDLDLRRALYGPAAPIHRRYRSSSSTRVLLADILANYRFSTPYADLHRDAERVANEIDARWSELEADHPIDSIRMIESIFYRGSGAYLVGRIDGGHATAPFVLVLINDDLGVEVDAVLLTEDEVSVVFSYTRSHFHVDVARPSEAVRLLSSIMPRKPIAELYISLGYTKHGKTELYRDLLGHLRRSMDRFEHAPGDTGMVMIVFTLRYHDYVFKVIRDDFAYPKTNTREDVMSRYQLVFRHDRAGRLIEAQEFEHLTFDSRQFSPQLLEELATAATHSVTVDGNEVAIHHLYIERRVRPLNLFLREEVDAAARSAVLDYGQAIRDLATTNIFPGDLLLKNFGVTRHSRVIFYDYDELCLVTDCRFRELPTPRDSDEELSAEPWFFVGEHDIFPEEFVQFLGLSEPHKKLLMGAHGEIMTAAFWRDLKKRHEAGEILEVFPYPPWKRLAYGKADEQPV